MERTDEMGTCGNPYDRGARTMSDPALPATSPRRWHDSGTLQLASRVVVVVAGGWWILGQLASVLRPLLIAVFLCYVLLPS